MDHVRWGSEVILLAAVELGESSSKVCHSVVVRGMHSSWATGGEFWFHPYWLCDNRQVP